MFDRHVGAALAGAAARDPEVGRPGRQGGLPDPRRRLHGGRARQVREGRAAADGDPLRGVALQGAAQRLQRLGALPAGGGVGHLPALDRHPPPLPRSARPTTPSASERYVLTFENRSFRDVASFAPYEFVEILTNSHTYGGGGIFGLYSTVAADSLWAPYVFVHEFGHHFAGLADEYFTSAVAYGPARPSASSPGSRTSRRCSIRQNLKWKDLVTAGHAGARRRGRRRSSRRLRATSRSGAARSAPRTAPEDEMDALFREEQVYETKLLGTDPYSGKVGAFEGALYEADAATTGRRRTASCSPATRCRSARCAAARSRRVIDLYSR